MASGPIDLESLPTLVLCFDPDLPEAVALRNADEARVVCDRSVELPGAEEAPRLSWQELRGLPRGSLDARRLVVHTLRGVTPRKLAHALRQAAPDAECVLVDSHGSWFTSNGRGSLVLAVGRGARRALGKTPLATLSANWLGYDVDPSWPNMEATLAAADKIVDFAEARGARPLGAPPRVVHYIGALGPGGAERQLTLLAKRSKARGQRVEVWTTYPLTGSDAHYVPDLERAGVAVRALDIPGRSQSMQLPRGGGLDLIRDHLSSRTLYPLIVELLAVQPDVLHCWLDGPNAQGGLAGLLAGVPRILLSTRNVSPVHFPRFLQPWFRDTYRALARSPRVAFVANSRAGAEDYAAWIGIGPQRFRLVYNGFEGEQFTPLPPAERAARRAELGLREGTFLVVGMFRLDEEKRPHDFVRVVARLRELVPALRVLHLGVGALEAATHAEAERLGLGDVLEFCGRVPDPWRYLQAADASVLVSDNEGCPNASLESQALGVPLVATRVGGTAETLDEGETGFLCELGDVEAVAARLAQLAADPALRARMGAAGRELITARFGIERMVDESLALYTSDPAASAAVE